MGVRATYDFAGSGALDANWTNHETNNNLVRSAGVGVASNNTGTTGFWCVAAYTGDVTPNDQYAKCILPTVYTVTDEGCGPMIRCSNINNFYFLQCNTVESRIYRRVGGTFQQVGADGPAFAANDEAYLEIQGTSLIAKKNGTTIITATDANLASGKAGILQERVDASVDNFEVGDFTASDTLLAQAVF